MPPFETSFLFRNPQNPSNPLIWFPFPSLYCLSPWLTNRWTYPFAAIPEYAFQVSEQTIDPVDTFLEISSWRVTASTSSTTSAQTWQLRHRIPKTGCFFVPLPSFVPRSRIDFRLFFHWPQIGFVHFNSTREDFWTSLVRTRLTIVRALMTLFRSIDVRRAIFWLLCSSRNQSRISFHWTLVKRRGRRCGVNSYWHCEHRLFLLPSRYTFFDLHFGLGILTIFPLVIWLRVWWLIRYYTQNFYNFTTNLFCVYDRRQISKFSWRKIK